MALPSNFLSWKEPKHTAEERTSSTARQIGKVVWNDMTMGQKYLKSHTSDQQIGQGPLTDLCIRGWTISRLNQQGRNDSRKGRNDSVQRKGLLLGNSDVMLADIAGLLCWREQFCNGTSKSSASSSTILSWIISLLRTHALMTRKKR